MQETTAMKAAEIRQMNQQDLLNRLAQEEQNLAQMRFQVTTSQLTNTSQIRLLKKDIARMKTVLTERQQRGESI
jgi:large subunit ribosomal protein L29